MSENELPDATSRVFISYSRKDKDFVVRLNEALAERKIATWVDWEGIPLGTDWWNEIVEGIQGADSFVFVISPDSLSSSVCADELRTAEENNKRIIPILFREAKKGQAIPSALGHINWIFIRSIGEVDSMAPSLVETLNTDLDYVKEHTHLQGRAIEWEQRSRNKNALLRGDALERALAWQVEATSGKQPEPTSLQVEFIHLSRIDASRRQRNFLISVIGALVVTIFLAILSAIGFRNATIAEKTAIANEHRAETQQVLAEQHEGTAVANELLAATQEALAHENEQIALTNEALAEEQRQEAETQRALAEANEAEARAQKQIADARELASRADNSIDQGNLLTRSLLLTIESMRKFASADGDQVLRHGLDLLPTRLDLLVAGGARITQLAYSPDGRWLVSADAEGVIRVRDAASHAEERRLLHGGEVTQFVFHPNRPLLLSGSVDGTARLWNLETGEEIARLEHETPVTTVTFSPSGIWMATGSAGGLARTWTMTSYVPIASTLHQGAITAIAFSSGGGWVATGSLDSSVRVWSATNGDILQGFRTGGPVNVLAFHPEKFFLAAGGTFGEVIMWDVTSGGRLFRVSHEARVTDVAFSADGSFLGTSSVDGSISVWDAATGLVQFRFQHDQAVNAIVFNPVRPEIAAASDDTTGRIWSLENGEEIARFEHSSPVLDVTYFSNGLILAAGTESGEVGIWSEEQLGQAMHDFHYTSGFVDLDFSPDEKLLATASEDNHVLIWSVDEDRVILEITDEYTVLDVDFSTDGRYIATGDQEGFACVWNAADGSRVACEEHGGGVLDVDFNPESTMLITGSEDGIVRVWDFMNDVEIKRFQAYGQVGEVAMHPDGQRIAAASLEDESALVWDYESGDVLLRLEHPAGVILVEFIPEKEWLVTVSTDNGIRVWNDGTGLLVDRFFNDSEIHAIEISPDGSLIAIAGQDNIARVREFITREEVARIVHTDEIRDVIFNNAGTEIVTAGMDHRVLISELAPDELIARACARLTRNLSMDEWREFVDAENYARTCANLPAGPGVVDQLFADAGILAADGDREAAVALLEFVLTLDESLDFDPEVLVDVLLQRGLVVEVQQFWDEGRVEAALQKYNRLLENHPDVSDETFADLAAHICTSRHVPGFESEVLSICDNALALAGDSGLLADLYASRAVLHAWLGDYAAAAADLRESMAQFALAFSGNPDRVTSYNVQTEGLIASLQDNQNPYDR